MYLFHTQRCHNFYGYECIGLAMEWKRNVYLSECVIHIWFFWCTICRLFFVQKWIKCIEEYTVFILLLVLSITCSVLRTKGMLPFIFGCLFLLLLFFVRCNHNWTVVEIWNFVATKYFPTEKPTYLSHIKLNSRAAYSTLMFIILCMPFIIVWVFVSKLYNFFQFHINPK